MLWTFLASAWSKSVPLRFDAQQTVYAHPPGWLPKGVSRQGVSRLEAEADNLHYPFYVVMIQGERLPGRGDGLTRLQKTTDELMADWGSQGLDLSRYSVFAVAWGDDCDKAPNRRSPGTVCKYFLNTGSAFIHGPANFLPRRDHEPYTDRFLKKVATTPQDPAGGILSVMHSVDTMLWDRTDPKKLLGRAQAELKAAVASRRQLVEGPLPIGISEDPIDPAVISQVLASNNIAETHELATQIEAGNRRLSRAQAQLKEHRTAWSHEHDTLEHAVAEDLPGASPFASLLDEQPNDLQLPALQNATTRLRDANKEIAQMVAEEQAAMKRRRLALGAAGTSGGGALFLGGIGLAVRRRRRKEAEETYFEARDGFHAKLDNAVERYMNLELQDRSAFAALSDAGGTTETERKAVTRELDEIYVGIQALRAHIQRIDQ